jgi:hypothetical protein
MRGGIVKHATSRAVFFGAARPHHEAHEDGNNEEVYLAIFQKTKI